ncbi:MAG TPA: preprotein translocase subunit SecE [Caulobacteraceae bacterium]|jgi:preprotein translocase subunit SecE
MAKDQAAGATGARMGKNKPPKGRSGPAKSAVINAPEKDDGPPRKSLIQMIMGFPQFVREVRAEGRKITWPSRNETWITSVMVGIMILITIVFFFAVDLVMSTLVGYIIKIGAPS